MRFEHPPSPARRSPRALPEGAIGLGKSLIIAAGLGLGLLASASAAPWQLAVRVEGAVGGQVDGLPDGGPCATECLAAVPGPVLASLLAEPDAGFRFAGWQGACEDTLGPLCTLPITTDAGVGARFAPEAEPVPDRQAVLLLHDEGDTPALWTRVVDRQFEGRCPVVYGGVALGRVADLPPEALYCYRLRLGYYAALGMSSDSGGAFGLPEWQSELRAAVAGIKDVHPRLRLVLVGKGRAVAAAQGFLDTPSPERDAVVGLLAVASPATLAGQQGDTPTIPVVGEQAIAVSAWELLRSR